MSIASKTLNKRENATRSNRKKMKSSLAARRLIRAAVKHTGSQRKAARWLGLPTQAQLVKMLHGQLRDTPAMRAALKRADRRAQRAWAMIKMDDGAPLDREMVCKLVHQIEVALEMLKSLCH